MHPLIQPTSAAHASIHFAIPPLFWSPDPDLVRGANGSTINNYPGRELAPREITLLLHAAPGQTLPPNARAYLEVRTSEEPEHYEVIWTLTTTNNAIVWRGPIELARVRKDDSEDAAYGVMSIGLFEPGGSVAE